MGEGELSHRLGYRKKGESYAWVSLGLISKKDLESVIVSD